jgi:hypothetical protein
MANADTLGSFSFVLTQPDHPNQDLCALRCWHIHLEVDSYDNSSTWF